MCRRGGRKQNYRKLELAHVRLEDGVHLEKRGNYEQQQYFYSQVR